MGEANPDNTNADLAEQIRQLADAIRKLSVPPPSRNITAIGSRHQIKSTQLVSSVQQWQQLVNPDNRRWMIQIGFAGIGLPYVNPVPGNNNGMPLPMSFFDFSASHQGVALQNWDFAKHGALVQQGWRGLSNDPATAAVWVIWETIILP